MLCFKRPGLVATLLLALMWGGILSPPTHSAQGAPPEESWQRLESRDDGFLIYWPATLSGLFLLIDPDEQLRLPNEIQLVERGFVGHLPMARLARTDGGKQGNLKVWIGLTERPSTVATLLPEMSMVEQTFLQSPLLLNPEGVQPAWFAAPITTRQQAAPSMGTLLAQIKIQEAGWYEIRAVQLQALGIDPTFLEAAHLRLTQGGQEVTLSLSRLQGPLQPNDLIGFYVEPQLDRYRSYDTLQLWSGGTGSRIAAYTLRSPTGTPEVQSSTESTRFAPRHLYQSSYPGPDGDYWFWKDLRALSLAPRTPLSFSLPLNGPLPQHPGSLTITLQGHSGREHAIALHLNGVALGETSWTGTQSHSDTFPIPAGVLALENELTLTTALSPALVDGSYLDGVTITFGKALRAQAGALTFSGQGAAGSQYAVEEVTGGEALLLDVTDPQHPIRLDGFVLVPRYDLFLPIGAHPAGAATLTARTTSPLTASSGRLTFIEDRAGERRYHVVTRDGVRQPLQLEKAASPIMLDRGADLLIIAPRPFHQALAPLIAARQAQGLRVRLVDLEAVYQGWNAGRAHPQAIRAFAQDFFAQTPAPAPSYLLLVGDGSYDTRLQTGDPIAFPLPAFLAHVDPWLGETASDHQYSLLQGEDRLSDIIVGRIPARTAREVEAVVHKTLAYQEAQGEWLQRALLVADDDSPTMAWESEALSGSFAASAESALAYMPDSIQPRRFYYQPSGTYANRYTSSDSMRQALHQALTEGAQWVLYFGHSSYHQWAVERFLHVDDLSSLQNQGRTPIVLNMTCFTGAFHLAPQSLDEGWLLQADSGAVALWSASGLGLATGHDTLLQGFLQARYGPSASRTLGEATLAGQFALAARGRHLDLLDTYHLFGDPTLPWAPLTP